MSSSRDSFATPILLIIFNRPETTRQVFGAIKEAKPARLYVAADGSRPSRPGEEKLCEQARDIVRDIDWPCEVYTKFSDSNQGCKMGVSSAINWFFEHEEEGIILEDDCLPHPSFFLFCQKLLETYRNDKRIMMISGDNFQFGQKYGSGSYYFSHFCHIWGWATWRRAWKLYELSMESYPRFRKDKRIGRIFPDRNMQRYWLSLFNKLYENKIDTWDGQWVYSIYQNGGMAIIPNKNLVTNIGFGEAATHTKTDSIFSRLEAEDSGPIIHPNAVTADREADESYAKRLRPGLIRRLLNKIRSLYNRYEL